MRLNPAAETIPADTADAVIRDAVAACEPAALLVAVAQITGDDSLLRDDLRPVAGAVLLPNGGLSDAQVAQCREVAADALIRFRDAGCVRAPLPSGDRLRRLLAFMVGGDLDDGYVPVLTEELALGGDLRTPQWHKDTVAPDAAFAVAIIGAGMSGTVVAHRLAQAGVPFVIFEKNPDVGGTWYENTYPGCRVDIPNHFYSFSFAQSGDWPSYYSTQPVLLDYFRTCAQEFGLRGHTRFGHEVLAAHWSDTEQVWRLEVRTADGAVGTEQFQAVVSAVGQLNQPAFPEIAGRDRFGGEWFHSARWRADVDLAGKRVGVIGTGASAVQFIPTVAEQAAHTTVFQRTPPWLLPVANNQAELPDGLRWLLRHVPEYGRWDRLWVFWRTHEGLLPMATVDPDWDGGEASVSAANDVLRQLLTGYFDLTVADPDLRAKVVPQYPPVAKRVVLDNGIWPATLQRDDVGLVTEDIAEITERGLRTTDGVEHHFDVLIYGTGFQASKFLTPMTVTGTGGVDLHEQWGGDARAYLGIVVPHFPNLFLMYGPNTNIVINGSIIYFSECEAHYIVDFVRMLLEQGSRSAECRVDVHDAYNERIDAGNRNMAWGASKVNSWYKNRFGRVAQNWPFSLLEYWQQTRRAQPDDYVIR